MPPAWALRERDARRDGDPRRPKQQPPAPVDDAAGLAISEKLSAQVSGLAQAQQNAQSAVNLVQTADGAMGEVTSMLQRVRDLAVQYNNGTLSTADQAAITAEVAQLCAEISSIGTDTKFNGIALLTGSA